MPSEPIRCEPLLRAKRELPSPAMRRAIREAAGATQQQVADEIEVRRVSIGRYESGEREPRGEQLLAYVAVLNRLREISS
jgi:transcriptional regulator with XRE-family HTH domain